MTTQSDKELEDLLLYQSLDEADTFVVNVTTKLESMRKLRKRFLMISIAAATLSTALLISALKIPLWEFVSQITEQYPLGLACVTIICLITGMLMHSEGR
ncbi:MAG: hypothetical protein AXW14_05405 [Alteromonas sp. Nap_26]|nr:MAG: hypothetical protein AXW14_05405 [Alteromonas sp. Nap_26]